MKNFVSTEMLRRIESNLGFVIAGIESFSVENQSDTEEIINALLLIQRQLFKEIEEAENE